MAYLEEKCNCSHCGASVPVVEFNAGMHDCPLTIPPREGEAWADYKVRRDAFRVAVDVASDIGTLVRDDFKSVEFLEFRATFL